MPVLLRVGVLDHGFVNLTLSISNSSEHCILRCIISHPIVWLWSRPSFILAVDLLDALTCYLTRLPVYPSIYMIGLDGIGGYPLDLPSNNRATSDKQTMYRRSRHTIPTL